MVLGLRLREGVEVFPVSTRVQEAGNLGLICLSMYRTSLLYLYSGSADRVGSLGFSIRLRLWGMRLLVYDLGLESVIDVR